MTTIPPERFPIHSSMEDEEWATQKHNKMLNLKLFQFTKLEKLTLLFSIPLYFLSEVIVCYLWE